MAQNPDSPKNDGNIKLPKVDSAMNKLPPALKAKAKKRKGSRKIPDMRDTNTPPALSENTDDTVESQDVERDEPEVDDGAENKGAKASKKSDSEDDADILKRMVKRFQRAASYEATNRKEELEDDKFLAGDQWPADVAAQRTTDKRPMLTVNKLPWYVHQVTNDIRQNRPGIVVSTVGAKGDPDAAKI